jgi:hypothetical protein
LQDCGAVVQQRGRPAATRRHAYFYPNRSTLTSIFSPNSYRILLLFDSKKKARFFLFNIHQLTTRDMAGLWSGCAAKSAVAVREPWLRSYFGWLAQWLRSYFFGVGEATVPQIPRGKRWALGSLSLLVRRGHWQ